MIKLYAFLIALITISCFSNKKIEILSQNSMPENSNSLVTQNMGSKVEEKKFVIENSKIQTVKPSNIIDALRKHQLDNPNITAKELADFGNDYIKKFGYDYTFDWTPKGKENKATLLKMDENFYPFTFQFTDFSNKQITFQLMNDMFEHPCFSVINIPITKVTDQSITIISDGKEFELKRPQEFYLEKFALLDKDLKKVIRKWKTPIDATPIGISEDGKKVYFETYLFRQNALGEEERSAIGLAVEVSEDGSLKLVDLNELKSDKGEFFNYDKKYTEINRMLFKIGNVEYNVKFSSPCT